MKKYIFLLGALFPTLVFGQLDRSIRPTPKAAPIINIKDSEVFKTTNGITVILSEDHKLPRVSFNLVMGSTPKAEMEMAGLSEVAGSLIMSGTTTRSKDQLDNEIDYIGASLSADQNSMYLSCLTKHVNKGLELMSDVLLNANFPESEVTRIIAQNESALLTAKSDAGTMAQNAEAVANFPKGHPYGEVMTEESLKKINRAAILNYYKENFTPKGSYLVVVGDVTKAQVTAMIDTYFSSWTGPEAYQVELGTGQFNQGNRVLFVKKPGAVQSVVYVSFPLNVKPGDADYLKLTVLNEILGGGVFGSRLMQNLREDKAYTYGCRSRVQITENGSWFSAGGNFRNDVTDSAITQILYEIEHITDGLVSDEEINLTKSSMAGGFARSLERPATVARFALNIIKNKLPKDYYQTYLKQLDAITKDDLLMVAQTYFLPKNCNIVVVGNEEILDRLVQFDADGEIEQLDAFGNPIKEVIPADISAEVLLDHYVMAVTQTTSIKKATKKLKKVKSMKEEMEMTMAQMPFPLKSTKIWTAAGVKASKFEMNGAVTQSAYFDGKTGFKVNRVDGKTDLTPEEIAAKNKTQGLIPELNYKKAGMTYEILGIEKKNGVECYVLRMTDGEAEGFDYFARDTYLKIASITITMEDGEAREVSGTYADYEERNGILFPMTQTVSLGGMTLTGKVRTLELNGTLNLEEYSN